MLNICVKLGVEIKMTNTIAQNWKVKYSLDVSVPLEYSESRPQFKCVRSLKFEENTIYIADLNGSRLERVFDRVLKRFQSDYEERENFDTTRNSLFTDGAYPTIKAETEGIIWRYKWNGENHDMHFIPPNRSTWKVKLPEKFLDGITQFEAIELYQRLSVEEDTDNLDVLIGYASDKHLNSLPNFRQYVHERGSWIVSITESRSLTLPLTPGIQNLAYDEKYHVLGKSPTLEVIATEKSPITFISPEGGRYKFCEK